MSMATGVHIPEALAPAATTGAAIQRTGVQHPLTEALLRLTEALIRAEVPIRAEALIQAEARLILAGTLPLPREAQPLPTGAVLRQTVGQSLRLTRPTVRQTVRRLIPGMATQAPIRAVRTVIQAAPHAHQVIRTALPTTQIVPQAIPTVRQAILAALHAAEAPIPVVAHIRAVDIPVEVIPAEVAEVHALEVAAVAAEVAGKLGFLLT